jgi:hypothetical protein
MAVIRGESEGPTVTTRYSVGDSRSFVAALPQDASAYGFNRMVCGIGKK